MNTDKTKYEVWPLNTDEIDSLCFGGESSWNLNLAIRFARQLNSLLARASVPDDQKAHVAITGGVLLNGRSEKDLDLIVFPHQSAGVTFPGWETGVVATLNKYLTEFYKFEPLIPCEGYGDKARDDKKVWYAARKADKRKVDFFFLS